MRFSAVLCNLLRVAIYPPGAPASGGLGPASLIAGCSVPFRGLDIPNALLCIRALKNRGLSQPQLAPRRGGRTGRRGPTVRLQVVKCCSRDRASSAAPARSARSKVWVLFGLVVRQALAFDEIG